MADGGKVEGPCKNKALQCEAGPGETVPVCMFAGDAGSSNDDAGTVDGRRGVERGCLERFGRLGRVS